MNAEATVLLVLDLQNGVVGVFGGDDRLVDQVNKAIEVARSRGIPVVFVRLGFREGHPEIARNNRGFAGVAAAGRFLESSDESEIHPGVARQAGDVIVTKRRISAFTGSDLTEILRGFEAETLVLTGVATSGVVLSTMRQAYDLDFGLVVLADACADADPEVHRVLMEKVFPMQASVVTVDDWITQD